MMNMDKLNAGIDAFVKKQKLNPGYSSENWQERTARRRYYQSFTKEKLLSMTEDDLYEYIGKLWSMLIWGNKKYVVDKLVAVADEVQIEKIKMESRGVIDEKSLRTWETDDVIAVYDALARAHESINKLALVPESF